LILNGVTGILKAFDVDCTFYCSIACCVQAQEQLMISYRGNNQVLFKQEETRFLKIAAYLSQIRLAIDCNAGNGSQVSFYIDEIRSLSNCTSDCDCSTDDFARVIGFGAIIGLDGTDGADGSDGAAGTSGSNGTSIIFSSTTIDTPVTGAYQTLKSFTMPAATLPSNGDAISILFTAARAVVSTPGSTDFAAIRLQLDSSDANPQLSGINNFQLIGDNRDLLNIRVTITRLSATTVMLAFHGQFSMDTLFADQGSITYVEPLITVSDLTLNSNLIDFQGFANATYTIVGKQLQIVKLLT